MHQVQWTKEVDCTSSDALSIVIFGYQLSLFAEEVGVEMCRRYDWIDSLWIDADVLDRTTLKLAVVQHFVALPQGQQDYFLDKLVQEVVGSVLWDFARRPLELKTTTRAASGQERK